MILYEAIHRKVTRLNPWGQGYGLDLCAQIFRAAKFPQTLFTAINYPSVKGVKLS